MWQVSSVWTGWYLPGVQVVTAWVEYEFSVAMGLVASQTPGRRKSIASLVNKLKWAREDHSENSCEF